MFKTLKTAWKSASTAEKINLVMDIICGVGAGIISGKLMRSMAPGMNKFERICAGITMSGLGVAAGEVAANAYKPHLDTIGNMIDKAKGDSDDGKSEQ